MKNRVIFIFFLITAVLQAQEKKQEREEGIERDEMPSSASFLIEKIPEKAKRVRFYSETDGENESYEVKFNFNKSIFSVEFGEKGKLQDVEVTLNDKEVPSTIIENIEVYLEESQERYKIEKIQAQYLPLTPKDSSGLHVLLRSLSFKNNAPSNYELIVAVKNNGNLKKFEMIFDENGHFQNKREIIRNSYDYLIF
jgi:hypothetical protein